MQQLPTPGNIADLSQATGNAWRAVLEVAADDVWPWLSAACLVQCSLLLECQTSEVWGHSWWQCKQWVTTGAGIVDLWKQP